MIDKLDKCLTHTACIVGIIAVLACTGIWLLKGSVPQSQQAAPSAVLHTESIKTITAPVQVYYPAVKKTLALPKAIQDSSAKVVLTSTDLSKSKHDYEVTAVLDTTTGETTQFVQVKPLKWLAKETSGSAGIYAGFAGTDPAIRAQVTQDVFTVKALTFGVVASVDFHNSGTTETFVGVGGRIDW